MLTLDTTIAGEKANSYIDANYLSDYWGAHYDTVTAGKVALLTDDQVTQTLIQATRIIETLHCTEPVDPLSDWHLVYDSRNQQVRSVKTNYGRPQKWNFYQRLQFPRTTDIYSDGTLYLPPEVQIAQAEQVGYIINFDPTIMANRLQGVSHDSINVGGVAISQKLEPNGSMLSPVAYQFMKPFLIRSNMRLMRS